MGDEYYERLGVAPDASAEEIAAAYRERLKETHPDVSDASDAKERTKRLIEAKAVLTDETERARYDRLGHERYVRAERGETPEPDATSTAGGRDTRGDERPDEAESGAAGGRSSGSAAAGPGGTSPGRGRRPGEGRRRERRSREYVGDGVDWDGWSDTDWDAVSDAVWEEVTGESTGDSRSGSGPTGEPGPGGSPPGWGHQTAGSEGGPDPSGTGEGVGAAGGGRAGGGATARPGAAGPGPAAGPEQAAAKTARPGGDSTVGWYQGGDPSGTGPNSWSVGGNVAGSWSGWNPRSNKRARYGTFPPHRILSPVQTAVLTLLCFVTFPLLVAGSVFSNFGPATKVVFATFLVFVVAVLIVLPQIGVAVFGSWTVLFPLAFAQFGVSLLSPYGVVALGVAVFSLGLAGLSWLLTRPPAI